jgi:hypothetical protein
MRSYSQSIAIIMPCGLYWAPITAAVFCSSSPYHVQESRMAKDGEAVLGLQL